MGGKGNLGCMYERMRAERIVTIDEREAGALSDEGVFFQHLSGFTHPLPAPPRVNNSVGLEADAAFREFDDDSRDVPRILQCKGKIISFGDVQNTDKTYEKRDVLRRTPRN